MPRSARRLPLVAALLALAAALPACGGEAEDEGALRAWRLEAPYLPPPEPSAAAVRRDASPDTPAEQRADDVARGDVAPGAPTDAEVAAALREAYRTTGSARDVVDAATIDSRGLATIPPGVPARLRRLMRGANEVARNPYVYGGGHGRNPDELWIDTAHDCSGSISFALATAGYLETPLASGGLARFGKPGPGRWVTIYANAGHAFMVVAGLRFDTSGRQRTGTRWQATPRSTAGFTVRHPPGL